MYIDPLEKFNPTSPSSQIHSKLLEVVATYLCKKFPYKIGRTLNWKSP